MDSSCNTGDGLERGFRGMPRPQHLFAPLKDDFYIYVVGCMMRYIRVERTGGPNRVRVLRTLNHGFDGVSALESNPHRDVYAMAEMSTNPRVNVYRIDKGRMEAHEPRIVAKLTGMKAGEIRALRFNKKDLIIVLTGNPSFSLSIWNWTTEKELMLALCNEPSEFSDLLISPMNECHWVEYGKGHLTFYDHQSFTKNDVIRTQIYLPQRQLVCDVPELLMGTQLAMQIISACFTHSGDLYVLDDHHGLHVLNQEDKILKWLCSIGFSYIRSNISQIVPYGDCIAEVHTDGWMIAYELPSSDGRLNIKQYFKLTSNIIRYYQFPGSNNSFYAMTEREWLVEGAEDGKLREPFGIPDMMYSNIVSATFIEPEADYIAILTEKRQICILDAESGELVAESGELVAESGELIQKWRLPFEPTCLLCHPVHPFLCYGTKYGYQYYFIDMKNLKRPAKPILMAHLATEQDSCFKKIAFLSHGRYLVAADTANDRIYLQHGYPVDFESQYLDNAKLPGEIRRFNVPGCGIGKEDFRFQALIFAKDKVNELCPSYVYNYSVENDKLKLMASQSIENPITAMALAPMKNYIYTYHVDKKKLGLTPFCDDNTWMVLQEPELWIESSVQLDINGMFVLGDKLYTFGEDGFFMIHEAPQLPNQNDQAITMKTILSVQTHTFVDGGIAEGIVSLDGSQVITIGKDGTFSRFRVQSKFENFYGTPTMDTKVMSLPSLIPKIVRISTFLLFGLYYVAPFLFSLWENHNRPDPSRE